jgi:hypothetical protein
MPEDQPQMPSAPPPPETPGNAASAATKPPSEDKYQYRIHMLIGVGAFLLLLAGLPATVILIVSHPPQFLVWLILPLILTGLGALVLVPRARGTPGFWPGFLLALGLVGLAFGICVSVFK